MFIWAVNNVQQKLCSMVSVGFYFHLVFPDLHVKWGAKTQGHCVEDHIYCIWNKNIQTYTYRLLEKMYLLLIEISKKSVHNDSDIIKNRSPTLPLLVCSSSGKSTTNLTYLISSLIKGDSTIYLFLLC